MVLVALVFLAALLAVSFVLSGVVPAWRRSRNRRERVEVFDQRYRRWVEDDDPADREWLMARRAEMQQDAMAVGRGVSMIAPPPAVGGQFQQHQMFFDLTSEQSFAAMLIDEQTRLDELAVIVHTLSKREVAAWHRIFNPLDWIRLAFERVVRFPRYLLRTAGFSTAVADSGLARAATVLWGALVGAATIGSFVLALLQAR